MRGIITVLGKDRVGIIAKVCSYLANEEINILDISQTIVGGFFNMMMIVDLSDNTHKFEAVSKSLKGIGEELGLEIKLQREDIFNNMHRI
ncbi:MAG: ACT domain-containing protein [Clostridiales bacterium]|nr:ACT domain-containing protein [Clostridiales bacterium]